MKRNVLWIAALATTMMTSCIYDNENDPTVVQQQGQYSNDEVEIYASLKGSESTTRAAYNLQSENLEDWSTVGIFVYKTGKTAAVSASTGETGYAGYENIRVTSPTTVATTPSSTDSLKLTPESKLYFPVDNSDVDVYVYSPYSTDYSPTATPAFTPNVAAMKFSVQDDQTEDEDYVKSDFIYGMATADYDADAPNTKKAVITMYHALSKVTFKITENGANAEGITDIRLKNVFKGATIDMTEDIEDSPTSGEPYLNNGSNTNVITDKTVSRGDVIVAHYDPTPGATHTANFYSTAKSNGVSAIIPPHSSDDLRDTSGSGAKAVKVSVTIDNVTKEAQIYKSSSPAATTDVTELLPGFEYVFNLKINASEIILVVVSVKPWEQYNAGDRDLNF